MTVKEKEGRQVDLFADWWLPTRPYAASRDLSLGVQQMSREKALTMPHVQTNAPSMVNTITIDVDHDDSVFRALHDRKGWRPSWVAENPVNGHAHVAYVIHEPVTTTEFSRRKPLYFLNDVGEGLRRSLDGDVGYSGFMTKSPVHEDWKTYWGPEEAYELGELAEFLRESGFMPPFGWHKRIKHEPVGLGRNCTLFETVRQWAYPEINNHWGDPEGLANAIEVAALQMNVDLFTDNPLPSPEVMQIARSVSRWIVRKSKMWRDGQAASDARFSARQSKRGTKGGLRSGEARRKEKEVWMQEALGIIEGSG